MSEELWDAPNQQVVRRDASGPWEEGTGGEAAQGGETPVAQSDDLDAMTKDELLAKAQEMGISPANAGMNKDELKAAIEAA